MNLKKKTEISHDLISRAMFRRLTVNRTGQKTVARRCPQSVLYRGPSVQILKGSFYNTSSTESHHSCFPFDIIWKKLLNPTINFKLLSTLFKWIGLSLLKRQIVIIFPSQLEPKKQLCQGHSLSDWKTKFFLIIWLLIRTFKLTNLNWTVKFWSELSNWPIQTEQWNY